MLALPAQHVLLFILCFDEMSPWKACAVGSAPTVFRRLDVNLFLSEKRGGKSHFGIILVSAVGNLKVLHRQPFAGCYLFPCKQSRILRSLSC